MVGLLASIIFLMDRVDMSHSPFIWLFTQTNAMPSRHASTKRSMRLETVGDYEKDPIVEAVYVHPTSMTHHHHATL